MTETHDRPDVRRGRLRMPRTRGAASGLLLIMLGAWEAAAPFVGPSLGFAFGPSRDWTASRGWLEVLPGIVTVAGGCLLLVSRNRLSGMLGGWLAVIGGAWFVVGRAAAGPLALGDVGAPVASNDARRLWLELTYFLGLGVLIVLLAAFALGRLSVRTLRDLDYARRPVATVETTPTAAEATEPVAATETRSRRWWGRFGRRHTHAH